MRMPKMGWLPDLPDFRDYHMQHAAIVPIVSKIHGLDSAKQNFPQNADLRQWCSPVENQGDISSCTANAGAGMIEYFERKTFGNYVNVSRLFLYKTTRNLMHVTGDVGAYLRTTMKAMALFGVPPESEWPYESRRLDEEPLPYHYAYASNFQALEYYRLDTQDMTPPEILKALKTNLSVGLPLIFGFTVYNSIRDVAGDGIIPFPSLNEGVEGGHAVMAVGYDDALRAGKKDTETIGALLIRNSWGSSWGAAGYGWLPYEYVLKGLAVDFWSLIKMEWVDTKKFGSDN